MKEDIPSWVHSRQSLKDIRDKAEIKCDGSKVTTGVRGKVNETKRTVPPLGSTLGI